MQGGQHPRSLRRYTFYKKGRTLRLFAPRIVLDPHFSKEGKTDVAVQCLEKGKIIQLALRKYLPLSGAAEHAESQSQVWPYQTWHRASCLHHRQRTVPLPGFCQEASVTT